MMKTGNFRILVINPGSTSTKVSVFLDEEEQFTSSISHSRLELEPFERIWDQYEFRKALIKDLLEVNDLRPTELDTVVARGGLFRPVAGGTYIVNQVMIEDGRRAARGEHASNLGAVIAFGIAWDYHIPAYIVDPPSVDEFMPVARISGRPEIGRESLFHALNVKAMARQAAKDLGLKFSEANFIVAHLGGGISVAAVKGGRVVDSNNALSSGPFTPERAGQLQTLKLVEQCFSDGVDLQVMRRRLVGEGGLYAHLGTTDCREIERRIEAGDRKALRVYEAMIYSISSAIGSRAVALQGRIDAVLLTGGIAHSDYVAKRIEQWVGFLGRVIRYPGQDEMKALALGALRVLRGEEEPKTYPEEMPDDPPDNP